MSQAEPIQMIADGPIKHDGDRYQKDDPFTCNEKQCAQLESAGAAHRKDSVAEVAPDNGQEIKMSIQVAIANLNPDDETHWTKSGAPDANVLGELMGTKVSAKARDAAWADYQQAQGASDENS